MKTKELKTRSVDELLTLQRRIGVIIKTKQAQLKTARERILTLAKRYGVSLREIGLKTGRGPDKKPRKTKTASAVAARYAKARQKSNGSAESRVTH